MRVFSLNKSVLAKRLSEKLVRPDDDNYLEVINFSDGEYCPVFKQSIRHEDVYIIADGHTSNDIMKLLLTIDAAKRSGAGSVSVIMPYLPYSRSDKNDHIRQSIAAKLLADVLTIAGINKLMTIDLHNNSIQGFYNVPVIHLLSNRIFLDYIKDLKLDNLCFVAPDHGATKRTLSMAKNFPDSTFAVIDKKRNKPNEIASMTLLNSVEGKNVIIVDDLGDTMNTICKGANLVMKNGALSVRAVLTHPVLSRNFMKENGDSLETISKSPLKELIVSDTVVSVYDKLKIYNEIFTNEDKPKISIISCDNLLVNSVERLMKNESISDLNS